MDQFAQRSRDDRQAIFRETAARMGVGSPVVSEKDFWVSWILKRLFSLEGIPSLMFKGGTSLSKAFGLIERFSEDIDLAMDRHGLGFTGDDDPLNIAGTKARKRRIQELSHACEDAVRNQLVPKLRAAIDSILGSANWDLETEARADGQLDVTFQYPAALEADEYGGLEYIRPLVRLEIGSRSDQEPTERVAIRPYAGIQFPEELPDCAVTVRALAPERTFWEKATILHAEAHREVAVDRLPPAWLGMSRHAYDLVMMKRRGKAEAAIGRIDLLAAVTAHKQAFYPSRWARYEDAGPGTLRLTPGKALEAALRADYERMQPMIFGEAPTFGEILVELQALEERINALT